MLAWELQDSKEKHVEQLILYHGAEARLPINHAPGEALASMVRIGWLALGSILSQIRA